MKWINKKKQKMNRKNSIVKGREVRTGSRRMKYTRNMKNELKVEVVAKKARMLGLRENECSTIIAELEK